MQNQSLRTDEDMGEIVLTLVDCLPSTVFASSNVKSKLPSILDLVISIEGTHKVCFDLYQIS